MGHYSSLAKFKSYKIFCIPYNAYIVDFTPKMEFAVFLTPNNKDIVWK